MKSQMNHDPQRLRFRISYAHPSTVPTKAQRAEHAMDREDGGNERQEKTIRDKRGKYATQIALSKLSHQLGQRTIPTSLQRLMTVHADAQAAEHTAMPNLAVELLARHARQWAPHVLRYRHGAVRLEAGEVNLVQWRCNGLHLREYERWRKLLARHGGLGTIWSGNKTFQWGRRLSIFGRWGRKCSRRCCR